MARHLNICPQSIYVTVSGSWRLAGFEYVWKKNEVTKTLLNFANAHRCQAAIDPDEPIEQYMETIEQYAFATLCEEIFSKCSKNQNHVMSLTPIPHVQEFREYCVTHLKHKNPKMRPKLSAVLLHPYFNHEFVLIHSFLFELPVKSVQEKQEFFAALIDRLRYFDEEVVGSQFAGDLLSRMVLLDPTAQLCVTPYVLRTKTDQTSALFSCNIYNKYLMPHILKMFRLKDAQIRLILLEYFMEFIRLLNKEQLEEHILPHLIVGMQDTNDILVAKTLRCMADLIPILGATTVIGGQRVRLFADGRPQAAISDANTHWVEPRSITPVLFENNDCPMVSGSPLPGNLLSKTNSCSSLSEAINSDLFEQYMPPRLSPDGGEDIKAVVIQDLVIDTDEKKIEKQDEDDKSQATDKTNVDCNVSGSESNVADIEDNTWSDWDNNDGENSVNYINIGNNVVTDLTLKKSSQSNITSQEKTASSEGTPLTTADSFRSTQSKNSASYNSLMPSTLLSFSDDLSCLDIQVQKSTTSLTNLEATEFDFFKDMEPIIETSMNSQQDVLNSAKYLEGLGLSSSKFTPDSLNDDGETGWQVDEVDDVANIEELIKASGISPTNI